MPDIDIKLVVLVVVGVIGLFIALWLIVFKKKNTDDFADMAIEHEKLLARERPDDAVPQKKSPRSDRSGTSSSGCEHHWEVTGIPPDKIGTHLNITCRKCSQKKEVPITESYKYLRQREDVRDAQARARGHEDKQF